MPEQANKKKTRRQTQKENDVDKQLIKEQRTKKKHESMPVVIPLNKHRKTTPTNNSPKKLAKKKSTNEKLRDSSVIVESKIEYLKNSLRVFLIILQCQTNFKR